MTPPADERASNVAAPRTATLIPALFIVQLLGAMSITIVGASLATIVGDLGGVEHIAWIVTAYTLASTIALPVVGQLGDIFGRRRVLLASIALYVLGTLLCGFADSMAMLTLMRAVTGLGSAGIALLPQTIVADVYSPRERARWASLLGSVFGIATVVGPALGGLITDSLGWRWIFFLTVPLGIVAFALAWRSVPHLKPEHTSRLDYRGAALLGVLVTSLTLVTTLGGSTWAWASVPTIVTGAAGLAAGVAFVLVELRAPHPIVPLRMFRAPGVWQAVALGVVTGIGLLSLVSYLPAYTQMHYNTSAVVAGLVPIGITFGLIVASNGTGHFISRSGRYWAYPVIGTLLASAALATAALTLQTIPLWGLVVLFMLVGLGSGTFLQLSVVLVQSGAPRRFIGVATSTTNLIRMVGVTLGTAAAGGFLGATLTAGLASTPLPGGTSPSSLTPAVLADATAPVQAEIATAYADAMAPILVAVAVVYALGAVAAVLMPKDMLAAPEDDAASHSRVSAEQTGNDSATA